MRILKLNEPGSECIPSVDLVRMVTAIKSRPTEIMDQRFQRESRKMKTTGICLLIFASVYFVVHLLAWMVRP